VSKKRAYDVIIVGAGPAGIFAALELSKSKGLRVLILEKGRNVQKRMCSVIRKGTRCTKCNPCNVLNGWGGAGAFSDGKLTLSTEIGGLLSNYIPTAQVQRLIEYADAIWHDFGAPSELFGTDEDEVKEIQRKAVLANLHLIPARVRHLGTDMCLSIAERLFKHLETRVEIRTSVPVRSLISKNSTIAGVETAAGEIIEAKHVIVAPGRQGSEWLTNEAKRLDLKTAITPVDLGVRVEVPAEVALPITKGVYESKFIFYSKHFDDKVRTFCMCPHGEVVSEYSDGVVTVNGHSYANLKTDNTNFALLVSKGFTEPFMDPIGYGQYIARLANLLSGGVMVQRLGDLEAGRRSTNDRLRHSIVAPTLKDATPGDLSLVLPYRHLSSILEMLHALDHVARGIYSRHTLLYGVEVKFYSSLIHVNENLETTIGNLFAAGDGAGITRGLMQASASGIVAAREILKRSGYEVQS
jgi:uncharacterized FAD-dependent dehydrogenase